MKKYLSYILIIITLIAIYSPTVKVSAVQNCSDAEFTIREECKKAGFIWAPDQYNLLAPLPNPDGSPLETFDPTQPNSFGAYLNLMIKIFIGLCAVLSVVMIVIGGLEYMTSELAHTKEAGKERITQAILGLLIALGAYALLFTINPDLLKSDLNPPPVTTPATPAIITPTPTAIQQMPQDMKADIETGRAIYSIHTTRSNTSPACSVEPNGYNTGKIVGGVGSFCGAGQISPERDGYYTFCCKYDRLTQ